MNKLLKRVNKEAERNGVVIQITPYGSMCLLGDVIRRELKGKIKEAQKAMARHDAVESKFGYGEMYIAGVEETLKIVNATLADVKRHRDKINTL